MNQKENFLQTLIHLTRESNIKWNIDNIAPKLAKYIANFDTVSQVFISELNENKLYFVIQKYIQYSHDFDIHFEEFTSFIFVISGHDLVYSIYEYEVSEHMLDELLEEIRSSVESCFYNNFMKEIN